MMKKMMSMETQKREHTKRRCRIVKGTLHVPQTGACRRKAENDGSGDNARCADVQVQLPHVGSDAGWNSRSRYAVRDITCTPLAVG